MRELIRDPYDLSKNIPCIPLSIERGEGRIMLPGLDERLELCDEILLCGTEHSEVILDATLNNPYTLDFLVTGVDAPRGYVFQWLAGLRKADSVLPEG